MILTKRNLKEYLRKKDFVSKRDKITIEELFGGWLNPLFLVKTKEKSFVVKQILNKGKKSEKKLDKWILPKSRMLNEYHALRIAHWISPENVPKIYGVDFDNFVMIMEYIEDGVLLEDLLRKEKLGLETIQSLVEFLLNLHNKTIGNKMVEIMVSQENYWPLKFDLQYLKIKCSKKVKEKIRKLVENFRNICLVHGDYNTRNILVKSNNEIATVDFEETGFKDPAHDMGVILAHLVIFNYVYGTVGEKLIEYFFDYYIKKSVFKNKKDLKKAILAHIGSIIISRFGGDIKYDWIPKETEKVLKKKCEKAILSEANNIRALF